MSNTVKITLTDARPMLVKQINWPLVSKASDDTDHNNQELNRRYYLRVRVHAQKGDGGLEYYGGDKPDAIALELHADGRCVVYGWSESSYQGESGNQAGYVCSLDDAPDKIRAVGEAIGAEEWLIMDCISDLPPVTEPDQEVAESPLAGLRGPLGALAGKWIADEKQYREQVEQAMSAGTPFAGMMAHADQLAECRRALQEAASLVSEAKI